MCSQLDEPTGRMTHEQMVASGMHECASDCDPVQHYRIPIRSTVSDETFSRSIVVFGPKDLENQLAQLRSEYAPDYEVGSPVRVAA